MSLSLCVRPRIGIVDTSRSLSLRNEIAAGLKLKKKESICEDEKETEKLIYQFHNSFSEPLKYRSEIGLRGRLPVNNDIK